MTYAPPTLIGLAHYWVGQGGINSGIVGDTNHQAGGVSYHLGKSQLRAGAYSAQTARDKAGLTEAASAFDMSGSLASLQAFSKWLVGQARANKPGTSDMREIIYSPDGKTVLRWDRQRGYNSLPRAGEADNTHLWHTHISWYRDAQARDHTTAFRPYFEKASVDVPQLTSYVPGQLATIKKTANVRATPTLAGAVLRTVVIPETWSVTGWTKGDVDAGSDQWLVRWANGRWEYTAKSNVSTGPAAPVPDCTAAINAATTAATLAGRRLEFDRQFAGAKVALAPKP